MKKSGLEVPATPRNLAALAPSHGRKLQAAIETVFRLTHEREMTSEERRSFGLVALDGPRPRDVHHFQGGNKSQIRSLDKKRRG